MTTPDNPYGQPPSGGQPPSWQTPAASPPPGYAAPPPGYGAPPAGYGAPVGYGGGGNYPAPMANGLGVAALILGILSIPFGFLFIGGLFGILAIVFGFVGRGRVKRGQANNGGVALAGIITGFVGILVVIGFIVVIAVFANSSSVKKLENCNKAAVTQADRDQCAREFSNNLTGNNN